MKEREEILLKRADEFFSYVLGKPMITSNDYESLLMRLGSLTIILLNMHIGKVYKAEKAETMKRTYLKWLSDNLR